MPHGRTADRTRAIGQFQGLHFLQKGVTPWQDRVHVVCIYPPINRPGVATMMCVGLISLSSCSSFDTPVRSTHSCI